MTGPSYTYNAKVVRWVDGDTVDLDVDCGFHVWVRTRFRLYGIDTPERGQEGYRDATEMARWLAPAGAPVVVQSHKQGDKYGRWLAIVTNAADININEELVAEGLASEYDGGAR